MKPFKKSQCRDVKRHIFNSDRPRVWFGFCLLKTLEFRFSVNSYLCWWARGTLDNQPCQSKWMIQTWKKKYVWADLKNTMKHSTFTHITYPAEPEGKPACVHHGLLLLTDSTNYKPFTPSTAIHQHIISADGSCVRWYLRMVVVVRSEGLNMKDKGNTDISKTFFFAFFFFGESYV